MRRVEARSISCINTACGFKLNALQSIVLYYTNNIVQNMKLLGSNTFPLLVLTLSLLVNQALATSNQDAQAQQRQTCQNTFFSTLVQLIPCRPAVAPFSPYLPSEACCSAVKGLGQPCLCAVVNGPPISGVDRNMAVLLPEKCTTNFEPCTTGRK